MKNLVDKLIEKHIHLNRKVTHLNKCVRASNEYGSDIQEEARNAITQYEVIKGMISRSR